MKVFVALSASTSIMLAATATARAEPACDGGMTVMAFGAEAAPAVAARARPMMLSLKIDRPVRTDLPGPLAVYGIRCQAMPELLSALKADPGAKVVGVYRKLGPEAHAKAPPATGAGMKTFDLIVLSNPTPGHEADYNRWYDSEHIPEVLQVPGFETAQRFSLVSNRTPNAYPLPRYAIHFVFRSADLQATADDIKHRLDTGVTHRSPYFDMGTSVSRYYAR